MWYFFEIIKKNIITQSLFYILGVWMNEKDLDFSKTVWAALAAEKYGIFNVNTGLGTCTKQFCLAPAL